MLINYNLFNVIFGNLLTITRRFTIKIIKNNEDCVFTEFFFFCTEKKSLKSQEVFLYFKLIVLMQTEDEDAYPYLLINLIFAEDTMLCKTVYDLAKNLLLLINYIIELL